MIEVVKSLYLSFCWTDRVGQDEVLFLTARGEDWTGEKGGESCFFKGFAKEVNLRAVEDEPMCLF